MRNKESGFTIIEVFISIFGIVSVFGACFALAALYHFIVKNW